MSNSNSFFASLYAESNKSDKSKRNMKNYNSKRRVPPYEAGGTERAQIRAVSQLATRQATRAAIRLLATIALNNLLRHTAFDTKPAVT